MKNKLSAYTGIKAQVFAATIIGLLIPCTAFARVWDITNYQNNITINPDSSLNVTETITADYTEDPHHGLLRDIPIKYTDSLGNNLSIRFKLLSVTDEKGNPWDYTASNQGDQIELKIGDPDVLVDKPETYKISYQVNHAINYFKDHDELYWNAVGTEWDTQIEKASATINLPSNFDKTKLQTKCFTGESGSTDHNCTIKVTGNSVYIEANPPSNDLPALDVNQGLTTVIGLPVGTLTKPSFIQDLIWFFEDNWYYGLPLLTAIILFFIWFTRGRDPKADHSTIMPYYEAPNGMTPAEVGTLIDEKADVRDLTASIIDLAVRGYIQIIETKDKVFLFNKNDYELKLLKQADGKLTDHEILLLTSIFDGATSIKLSDLNNSFYSKIKPIQNSIYDKMVKDGYFPTNPEVTRNVYQGIGVGILVVTFIAGQFVIMFAGIALPVSFALTALVFLLAGNFMPAKTKKGVETYYKILGLKEYIKTAETDRIKFQEKENIFEKLLPYAMALGIGEKWCKTFKGIYTTPPRWYTSSDPMWNNNFTPLYLYSHLNNMTSSASSAFTSRPSSAAGGSSGFGGGGFSGGGFGGGGGGSW